MERKPSSSKNKGLSNRDVLLCINEKDGKTAWTSQIAGKRGSGSIVDAGTVLFLLTPAGNLIAFEPTDKEFKQLASYKVADGDTTSYPVLARNQIFVKDKDSVAPEQGINPEDTAAVKKFDRNRPGKGSNQKCENPHHPDAKIGPKKDGSTDMIYKPEAVVDLDTDAVVQAEVQPGDQPIAGPPQTMTPRRNLILCL